MGEKKKILQLPVVLPEINNGNTAMLISFVEKELNITELHGKTKRCFSHPIQVSYLFFLPTGNH